MSTMIISTSIVLLFFILYFCIADDDSLFIKFTGHLSYPFFKIEDRGSYFSFFFFIGTCIPLPLVVQLIFLLTIIFFFCLISFEDLKSSR